jgi:hypothetical protein
MKKYSFYIGLFTSVLAIAAVNFTFDTRGIFHGRYVTQGFDTRISMPYVLLHRKPNGLILGNSTDYALDTLHPGWDVESAPILYANTSGARFYENLRSLQHATAANTPKQVVFGLYFDFSHVSLKKAHHFEEKRLLTYPNGIHVPRFLRLIYILPDIHFAFFSRDIYIATICRLSLKKEIDLSTIQKA